MDRYESQREIMVDRQIRSRGIRDQRILDAFSRVPRQEFVPKEIKSSAYEDRALPIGFEQTISQPYVVSLMMDMINPHPEHVILEMGAGSGYSAAILAQLCKKVISYERIWQLAKHAAEQLKRLCINNVEIYQGDGETLAFTNYFDRCVLTAGARVIPDSVLNACKPEGLILLPEGNRDFQTLNLYQKRNNHAVLIKRGEGVRFVPFMGQGGW